MKKIKIFLQISCLYGICLVWSQNRNMHCQEILTTSQPLTVILFLVLRAEGTRNLLEFHPYRWPLGCLHRVSVVKVGKDLCQLSDPTPCSSRAAKCKLSRAKSRQLFNISKDGDPTVSLVTLTLKNVSCLSVCAHFFLFLHQLGPNHPLYSLVICSGCEEGTLVTLLTAGERHALLHM